jgi:hypothetical protein
MKPPPCLIVKRHRIATKQPRYQNGTPSLNLNAIHLSPKNLSSKIRPGDAKAFAANAGIASPRTAQSTSQLTTPLPLKVKLVVLASTNPKTARKRFVDSPRQMPGSAKEATTRTP